MKRNFQAELEKLFPGCAALTPKQAARALGVSDKQVRNLIEEGKIVAVNIGTGSRHSYRIPVSALAHYQEGAKST